MYSFNERLEPKTISGLPMKVIIGAFIFAGSVVPLIAFPSFIKLIALPGIGVALTSMISGWKNRGIEHLLLVYQAAKSDLRYTDLGIDDE